eukprot:UN11687
MEIVKSDVLCPKAGMCAAVRMSDREKMEMLTFGYVRYIWKSVGFSSLSYLPNELIRLMASFCSKDIVYFLDDREHHWKIDLEAILK